MKVTISDVARLAGVSTATVSHTINSTRYVSGETKEKVYRAIAELGYTPDASARSFRTGKKHTVGFLVPDISSKFFGNMIEAAEDYLSAHGYHLIVSNTKEDMAREENALRLLTAGLVDGLLVASTMEDVRRFDAAIPAGFPVVLADRTFEIKKYPSVCVSNFQPIYRSVCRLAGRGKRRIGIIGGLPRLSSTRERVSAYIEAMQDCGLPVEDSLIRYKTSEEYGAQRCLDELLDQKCDAIIICRTSLAADALVYAHKRGIRLAEELELVTFLDYDSSLNQIYAGQVDCIVQPVEELGRAAGEQILARIENPDAPVFEKVLTSAYRPYDITGALSGEPHLASRRAAATFPPL